VKVPTNMPTFVRNTPKGHHVRNKLAMESPVHSTGHTHSMTSNREEVSWSSSEGSTYYSSDDGTSLENQDSAEYTDYSEEEVSLQQRKQTQRESRRKQDNNNASYSAKSYDAETDYQRPKQQKETTQKTKERPLKKGAKNKNKLRLENVDSFSAIDHATGSEDVSAVAFLSTEDTAEVFCKAGIPNEITANKKLYEKVSAISSASTGGSSAESSYASDSESDEESRIKGDKHANYKATKTERATVRSKASEVSTADTSVLVDQHAVDFVSVSYQDPVSSLECASTWDDLSLGSNTSGSSSVEKPRMQKTSKSPAQRREALTSHQRESKLSKMKEIKRKKSDLKTDERIRQLKAKIKSIQDLSTTHVTVSSSEVESHLSSNIQSKAMKARKAAEYENEKDDNKQEASEPLTNRFEEQQRKKSVSAKRDYRISFEGEKSLVGTMIPVVEREEVSVLRFDTSARAVAQGDIEAGPFRSSKCEKRTSMSEHTKALRNSISEHTKVLLTSVQYKTITAYDHMVPIVARKRAEFLRKPRYEQVLIVAIGSLFSIFIVLLFVMIAQ